MHKCRLELPYSIVMSSHGKETTSLVVESYNGIQSIHRGEHFVGSQFARKCLVILDDQI
jgi:hypothetical protein